MAKNDYVVIGLGRFGFEIAQQLHKNGKNVMVMDSSHDLVQKAAKIHEIALECDATDIDALSDAGVTNVRSAIVAISKIEDSIMVCANLKELGVRDIIARATNQVHLRVLKTMGVGRVVIPEVEVANKVAFQSLFNVGVDVMNFGGGFSWIKTIINNPSVTKKRLGDMQIRDRFDATVLLIQRGGKIIFPPKIDTTFEIGDVVTFMCREEKIQSIIKMFTKDSGL